MKLSFPAFLRRFFEVQDADLSHESPNIQATHHEDEDQNLMTSQKKAWGSESLHRSSNLKASTKSKVNDNDISYVHGVHPGCHQSATSESDVSYYNDRKNVKTLAHSRTPDMLHSPERRLAFEWTSKQQVQIQRHMPTPKPHAPPIFNGTHVSQIPALRSKMMPSECPHTPAMFSQHISSHWNVVALTTPFVLSSLDSLHSSITPADAFPDILQLTDHESLQSQCTVPLEFNHSSQSRNIPAADQVPKNDSEFVDMLITVADQLETEKQVPPKSFTYTRPEDVLQSRMSGQRKCRHAKRMTREEENYLRKKRQQSRENPKTRDKQKPKEGTRKSARCKEAVKYY